MLTQMTFRKKHVSMHPSRIKIMSKVTNITFIRKVELIVSLVMREIVSKDKVLFVKKVLVIHKSQQIIIFFNSVFSNFSSWFWRIQIW